MRALAVEDDPRIARDLVAALTGAGFRVETASDGEDAWFRGDTEDYDLIILDLGLPKLDGLAVLKRWRAAGRKMPVIILTARGAWAERVEGINSGAGPSLAKPFHMRAGRSVRALIRRSAGRGGAVQERRGRSSSTPTRMTVTLRGRPLALSAARIPPARLSRPAARAGDAADRAPRAPLRRRRRARGQRPRGARRPPPPQARAGDRRHPPRASATSSRTRRASGGAPR